MLHMDTTQSWNTILAVMALVGTVIYLVIIIEQRRRWDAENASSTEAEQIPVEPKQGRHLSLVPDLPAGDPELYDWQTQGL